MSGGILLSDNNSAPSIVVTQAPTSGETIPHVNLNVVVSFFYHRLSLTLPKHILVWFRMHQR